MQYAATKNKLETIKTIINLGTCDSQVKEWVYHVDVTCRPELQRWAAASLLMPAEEVLAERRSIVNRPTSRTISYVLSHLAHASTSVLFQS